SLVTIGSFFCQAEDGIRDRNVTGVQTCALPISLAICKVVHDIPWPIGRLAKVPPDHCSNAGKRPDDSFGNSIPVVLPNPNFSRYSANFSSPRRCAICSVPTLDDLPKIPAVVYGSTPWCQASATLTPAISMEPGTWWTSSGVVTPSSIAAAAVTTFATEPGS